MARYKLVASTNAQAGQDDAFNTWYDTQHLSDVVAVPGFISGERFVSVGETGPRYLAIYEIETDDIEAVIADFAGRPGTDLMPISGALDASEAQVLFWKPYEKS